jgi:hypothetical protein
VQGSHSEPEYRQQVVSADRESREFAAPAYSIICPCANDVLRKFDRDTRWIAAGLLGSLLLAAMAFVVLVPERHTMTAGLSERTKSGSWPTGDAATLFRSTDMIANMSTSGATPVTLPLVAPRSFESPSKESLERTETAGGLRPPPVPASRPEISHTSDRANRSQWSLSHQPDSSRSIRGKATYHDYGSAGQLGDAVVKKRLLELWHRSLAGVKKLKARRYF